MPMAIELAALHRDAGLAGDKFRPFTTLRNRFAGATRSPAKFYRHNSFDGRARGCLPKARETPRQGGI